MLYRIERTSMWWHEKPCEEAVEHETPLLETRTCTEHQYNAVHAPREGGLWRERGTNHCVTEKGYIRRQMGTEKVWCVNITSIKQLKEFVKKYGRIIFDKDSIEIYDDYRE